MRAWLGTLLVACFAWGCPSMESAPISKHCARMGDKCKLEHGPLGVCMSTKCADGAPAPCFICQPQH